MLCLAMRCDDSTMIDLQISIEMHKRLYTLYKVTFLSHPKKNLRLLKAEGFVLCWLTITAKKREK